MSAKTIKIGNEYYREGVKVSAPKQAAKKTIPKKAEGLAGDDKIAQAMADATNQKKIGTNLLGAAGRMITTR